MDGLKETAHLKMKVSITANYERGVNIELYDELSGITFVEVNLTNEMFVYAALNRLQRVEARTALVRGLDKVGMKSERKTISFDITDIPHYGDERQALVITRAKEYIMANFPGWDLQLVITRAKEYIMANFPGWDLHDQFTSQGSFSYKDGKIIANCNIVRWVPVGSPSGAKPLDNNKKKKDG